MTLARQGLITLASTTLPVYNHSLNLNQTISGQRSGADEYDTLQTLFGASPTFTFTGPLSALVTAIGFECTSFTTCNISLVKFDSTTGKSTSGASNVLFSLAESCRAIGVIDSIQCQQYGIATATVTLHFQSNNGTTHPVSKGTGSELSLAAQPTLHTLGPLDLAGTEYAGVRSFTGNLQHRITGQMSDGDQYPTLVTWFGASPVMQIETQDPDAVLAATTLAAADASTDTKMAFLQRDSDGTIGTTEYSLTVADGLISMSQASGSVDELETGTIIVMPASSDGTTHPWTVGA